MGKTLFFDNRLSGANATSCASCHNPDLGWSDGHPTARGHDGKALKRATPTILNTAYIPLQFWDGRAHSLEEQALGPIQSRVEMNQDLDELIEELTAVAWYRDAFEKAYPGEGINRNTIAKALASFERTIVSTESPFDRWIDGERTAISQSAQRGFRTFQSKGRCMLCHNGFNFTNDNFHNIGLKNQDDPGRYAIRKAKSLQGAFKTPTLRDIALTAPYMHDGSLKTLEEVIEHYNKGGIVSKHLDPTMKKLNLSEREKKDLVAFMKSLTGKPRPIELPKIP